MSKWILNPLSADYLKIVCDLEHASWLLNSLSSKCVQVFVLRYFYLNYTPVSKTIQVCKRFFWCRNTIIWKQWQPGLLLGRIRCPVWSVLVDKASWKSKMTWEVPDHLQMPFGLVCQSNSLHHSLKEHIALYTAPCFVWLLCRCFLFSSKCPLLVVT